MNTVNSQQVVSPQPLNVQPASRKNVGNSVAVEKTPELEKAIEVAKRQSDAVSGKLLPETNAQSTDSASKLDKAISRINEFVQKIQRDLQFSVDDESGKTVIKVIDSESKEVIRQIPEEVLLQVARSIEESLEGALLEVKA
jgi:flagellar protein FlaG